MWLHCHLLKCGWEYVSWLASSSVCWPTVLRQGSEFFIWLKSILRPYTFLQLQLGLFYLYSRPSPMLFPLPGILSQIPTQPQCLLCISGIFSNASSFQKLAMDVQTQLHFLLVLLEHLVLLFHGSKNSLKVCDLLCGHLINICLISLGCQERSNLFCSSLYL